MTDEADEVLREFGYCRWNLSKSPGGGSYWKTMCGRRFDFYVSRPKENNFRYCPYCGKDIVKKDGRLKRG